MAAIHVREVPSAVLEGIKRRARANRRSMQQELLEILAAASKRAPPAAPLPPLDLVVVETGRTDSWSREDIYGDDPNR